MEEKQNKAPNQKEKSSEGLNQGTKKKKSVKKILKSIISKDKEKENKKQNDDKEHESNVHEHPTAAKLEEKAIHSELHIQYEWKYFFVWEGTGEANFPVRISDFILTPLYTLIDENGNHSNVVRVEDSRGESVVITINSSAMTTNAHFKELMAKKGNFNWIGKQKHLELLYDYIKNYQGETVHLIDYVGYHREHKCWIYPTYAYVKGEIYHADKDGFIVTPEKSFKVIDNGMFKVIRPLEQVKPTKEEILEYLQSFFKLYGYQGLLGLGWVVAGFQVHMFEQRMDTPQFPYLFATGIFQSGKTQYMRRIFEIAGLIGKFDTNPTKDIWRKSVKAYGSLPINFDEVRDTGKNGFFNLMREVINKTFDRDDHKRGTLDPNAPLIYSTNAIVGLSGEVPTEDSAIMSRTVFVHSTKFKRDTKAFNRLARSGKIANWMGQHLQMTSDEWEDLIFDIFVEILEELEMSNMDSREATNYALCAAGAQVVLGYFGFPDTEQVMNDLLNFIKNNGEDKKERTKENHPSIQYLVSLGVLAAATFPKLEEGVHYIVKDEDIDEDGKDEKVLFIAPDDSFKIFQDNTKDWDNFYNSSRKILNDLESFKFFVGIQKKKTFSKSGRRINAWKINLDHPDLPEIVRNYFVVDDVDNDE
ncbi:hypothetical protein [Ammoniphilus sp. 3BR4]|uniref:hypothetical protein n=1 Tax=Ammoniphilus sp. 3BR4 TaxID=3158265 RepID=UPI0034668D36